jgi:hypothetical protein
VLGIFEIGSQELFSWGWLWTVTLPISASRVTRLVGVSHQRPAWEVFYFRITEFISIYIFPYLSLMFLCICYFYFILALLGFEHTW